VILSQRVSGVDNMTDKDTAVSADRKASVNIASAESGMREASHSQDVSQVLVAMVKAKLPEVQSPASNESPPGILAET